MKKQLICEKYIYTTQYRQDNLLRFIVVTLDVSQFDILPYFAIASADGLLFIQLPTALLIFQSLISSTCASTLVVPQSERSSRKSTAV